MKNIVFIILLLVVLTGCNEKMSINDPSKGQKTKMETGGKTYKPIIPNKDIIVFFQEYLPVSYTNWSGCHFFEPGDRQDKYIIINSIDEFKKSFSCSPDMLPAIDFKSNTLIIGHFEVSHGGGYITEQEIIVNHGKAVLDISYGFPREGVFTQAITALYYWGIYPKIENKNISMNLIYEGYI